MGRAAARLDVPRGNAVDVDPRSRGDETIGERDHSRLTYRPDLDGLRAIAVVGVLMAHAGLPFGDGAGRVGVNAFFVLSGYLITGILLGERERTGRIDLRAFYGRRIRRLAPALATLLAVVALLGLAGVWARPWMTGEVASLAYVGNWFRVAGLDLGPLGHTWSLAIEEQFYLAWPVLLILAVRRAVPVAVGLIVVAFLLRAGLDPNAAYYGSFTRFDAILAGCLLAIGRVTLPRWTGLTGLTLLVVSCAAPMDDALRLPLTTMATLAIIAGGAPILARLAPLGRRAYGIYLWDYPLVVLIGPVLSIPFTLAAAEISWRTVEARLRRARSDAHEVRPVLVAAA